MVELAVAPAQSEEVQTLAPPALVAVEGEALNKNNNEGSAKAGEWTGDEDVEMEMEVEGEASATAAAFGALPASELNSKKNTSRRVPIPPHRMTPLKKDWLKLYTPLVEGLGLQVRMNLKKKSVDVRTCEETKESGAVQRAADFLRAYGLGFEVEDAISLLRLDDLFIDTFEVKDVKTLHGDNLSRAIGRIVGKDGKTRFTIENTSRTRIVVADTKIHILGSFQNIRIAKDAVVALIMGASPGKIYSRLRTVSNRLKERF